MIPSEPDPNGDDADQLPVRCRRCPNRPSDGAGAHVGESAGHLCCLLRCNRGPSILVILNGSRNREGVLSIGSPSFARRTGPQGQFPAAIAEWRSSSNRALRHRRCR